MPSCSRKRRASPGRAIWCSPAPTTIPKRWRPWRGSALPSRPRVAAMVRGWHHGRMRATRSQRAREILTELVPELLRIFGATAQSRCGVAALRPISVAPAGRGAAVFAVSRQSRAVVARRRHHGRGAAPGRAAWRSAPALLDAVLTARILRAAAGPRRACRRSRRAARRHARFRGHARSAAALGRRAALSGRRPAAAPRASTATRPARRSPISPRPRSAPLLPAVTADFARRHGEVPGGAFAVVAMGRLGSREMTLASDLDLILIYDAPGEQRRLGRARPLARRDLLRTAEPAADLARSPRRPAEGRLYEVDMRLRPSGASGPIASSLAAFAQLSARSRPGPGSIWR